MMINPILRAAFLQCERIPSNAQMDQSNKQVKCGKLRRKKETKHARVPWSTYISIILFERSKGAVSTKKSSNELKSTNYIKYTMKFAFPSRWKNVIDFFSVNKMFTLIWRRLNNFGAQCFSEKWSKTIKIETNFILKCID